MQVEGPLRKRGGLKMTYTRVVNMDMKKCSLYLYENLAQNEEIECLEDPNIVEISFDDDVYMLLEGASLTE